MLWEHPEKDSGENLPAFEPQKISIDLSNYDAVMIMTTAIDRTASSSGIYTKGLSSYTLSALNNNNETQRFYIMSRSRTFTMDDSGITFENAWHGTITDAGISNGYFIPYQIFGIRFSK